MSTNYINQVTDTAGTTHAIMEGVDTRIFRGTCSTAADTAQKAVTLDDSTGFSLTAGVRLAVTFTYGNSAGTPTISVNSGTAKTIAYVTSATARSTGSGTSYNTWGPYETVIFTYDGTYWINGGSGRTIYNAYVSYRYPTAYCETAAATQAKAAYCTNYTLTENTYIPILFVYANSYNGKITLNINSKGAKDIYINGTISSSSNKTLPAGTYIAYYADSKFYINTDGTIPNIAPAYQYSTTDLTPGTSALTTGTLYFVYE